MLVALAAVAGGLAQIGVNDGRNDNGSDAGALRRFGDPGVVYPGYPLPDWPQRTPEPAATPAPAPAATPAPGPTDAPEPTPAATPAPAPAEPSPTPGQPLPPQPQPAGRELVSGVTLTYYSCVGDSTGSYCGIAASGQTVHRGAAACGYAWDLGQRFRILADPYPDTIYTCLDRGGGPHLWIDVWFYDATEGRAWRNHLPQPVTVEMMP